MAKDIRECLLEQARKFHQWQEITYPGKNTEEIGGEWEVDYPAWNDIFDAFCHVLTQMDAETADSVLLDEMVYLIARDNEAEGVIQETTSHPQWFECLCRRAVASNENEAKWQFAAYLPECSCSQKVRDIILDFAKDPNEYVSRRALLAMPALRPDCVEQFAPLFWERNCYSPELQEYQRIAVLVSLDAIHSDLLPQYLERAKQDGRSYLLEHAKRIEGGLSMNEKLFRTQFNHMDASEKQKLMEALTVPIYHGFLPPRSREKRIDLTPRLYAQRGERIHLTFLPLRPDCGNDPQWEDWNCYRSILTIGWPDCERLLIPALRQLFPVKDPTNGEVQEEFDLCFDSWIGKEDWERWILLVRDSLLSMTAEEAAFLRSILEWMETALTHTSAMIVESNL